MRPLARVMLSFAEYVTRDVVASYQVCMRVKVFNEMHRMKGCRIARFQHRRRESMRSSMKTPLTGQHLGMSLNNGLHIYYLRWPELLESNFEAASPSLFTVTCTTTRDRTRLSSGVYTTYRQYVRHKQLLDTFRGKVLYFI